MSGFLENKVAQRLIYSIISLYMFFLASALGGLKMSERYVLACYICANINNLTQLRKLTGLNLKDAGKDSFFWYRPSVHTERKRLWHETMSNELSAIFPPRRGTCLSDPAACLCFCGLSLHTYITEEMKLIQADKIVYSESAEKNSTMRNVIVLSRTGWPK